MSDIHGRYDKYQAMLEKIAFGDSDTLYVLGDVIDRGPDGVAILRDMMERFNVIPILGNHEFTAAMCLRWMTADMTHELLDSLDASQLGALLDWQANGGEPTIRSLDRRDRGDILEYIQEMDLYAEVEAGGGRFLLTHGCLTNFEPEKSLGDYEVTDFLFGRPQPEKVRIPGKTIILGHVPTRTLCGEDKILSWGTMIDIDCGCGWGGKLGCLCLETMEEFYV